MCKWNISRDKKGMVGLEAAIILIAFVIIAGAFSFMVINQGLFATERGKTAVQEGLQHASTPLCVDGSVLLRSTGTSVDAIMIPLRAYGVKYVAMAKNQTAVTLKVGSSAWSNIYEGVNDTFSANATFDDLVINTTTDRARLFIKNTNGDNALDSNEKGYLIIRLNSPASARDHVVVEIKPEKVAPLTVEFYVPESLQTGWMMVSG
ncbi:MAG: archaellin/type IV pilin N-terminal domain-containing protein [Candidatus Bathyarchaeia archaeon]